ncbi:MAG: amidohydrolase [Planctomycetes bacterium]|nr:amidohydrolase [Planctomycetota bacterium]
MVTIMCFSFALLVLVLEPLKAPVDVTTAPVPADLAVVNARIWTGGESVPGTGGQGQEPTAVAVAGERIVAVADDETIRRHITPSTRVIDAQRRRVIPGITDSHTHIVSGGFQLARLHLREVKGREEFVRAVEGEAKGKQPGEWVLGGRWSVESWDKPEPPRKEWIDPVTGNTPTFLTRMDGHQALANSAALGLAKIDAGGPPDPQGGEIERDPKTREPTGILKDSAMDLVARLIPPPGEVERRAALERAMRHANALGVTSVHDMSAPADLPVFRAARAAGVLTVRVTSYVQRDDWVGNLDEIARSSSGGDAAGDAAGASRGDSWFTVAGLKGYMDGSLGSRNAYMRQNYADATPESPYPRGQLTAFAGSADSFQAAIEQADAASLQVAIHAIGDEANHLVLDAYESVAKLRSGSKRRHRVEHVQHLLVEDIPRFARLGVVASMQPYHKADDGRYAEKAIGKERLKGSYAFRQLLDAGALLVFGSDWPVVTMDPFAGIDSAVTGRTLAGGVWLPEHSITVEEALRAYTVSPPKAVGRESELGTLGAGKLADFVILNQDPFNVPEAGIGEIRAVTTVVGGRVVYERP